MDPNKYARRAKFKSLPLDFQYQDAAGYESNWDYKVEYEADKERNHKTKPPHVIFSDVLGDICKFNLFLQGLHLN